MSYELVGVNMKIRCPDNTECADLELRFDGQRASFCDSDGNEHTMVELLGGDFIVSPVQAAIIMRTLRN